MFKNYWSTAVTVFTRNKIFTGINILGLSIGISAAIVIFLIGQYEFSYDKVETNPGRVYRVVMDLNFNGKQDHSGAIPAALDAAVPKEVSGVEASVPVLQFQGDASAKVTIDNGGAAPPAIFKKQAGIVFTSPQYFSLLPFRWLAGSPASSLQSPFTVVLTETRARQYFPSMTADKIVGRSFRYNDDFAVTVSGIVKDLNAPTSFGGVEFISFATIAQTHLQGNFMMDVWNDWMAYSHLYITVASTASAATVEKQINLLLKKYDSRPNSAAATTMHFRLQPLADVHFNDSYAGFDQRTAHKPTLYALFAVAAFLLLLACINFINLTTANAAHRAMEIGIRKTLGGSRNQLVLQFLTETFLLTAGACVLSFFFIPLIMDLFVDFLPPGLSFQPLGNPSIFLYVFCLALLVSFLSGVYPAFFLSSYKPISVLKNQVIAGGSHTRHEWIRKTLTVSQFVIAQFFVISTVVVSRQIDYSLNADMGFRTAAIVSFEIPHNDAFRSQRNELLQVIRGVPGVQMVSNGFLTPADDGAAFTDIKYEGATNENKGSVQLRWGDTNYLKLFNIKILAGRNVNQSDTIKEFLINETYSKSLGFKNAGEAIGKELVFNGKKMAIIGVMHDFHEQSFHSEVGSLVFASFGDQSDYFHVLLQPENAGGKVWSNAIGGIQKGFHRVFPDGDFSYSFLDDTIARFYEAERRTQRLLSWATGLSVFISSLGLLGLVMYTINTRTKEIGIRKLLGASVANIISILSKEFVQLVIIAFAIAGPVAWWATHKWLENYVYRTSLPWWLFGLCGVLMLLLSLATLSIQTLRAAIANPVKNLRSE